MGMFYPRYSCDTFSPKFVEYCKSALVRYMTWIGDINNTWGGKGVPDADINGLWLSYLRQLTERGNFIPDSLTCEIKNLSLLSKKQSSDIGIGISESGNGKFCISYDDVIHNHICKLNFGDGGTHNDEGMNDFSDIIWDWEYDWLSSSLKYSVGEAEQLYNSALMYMM